MYLVLSNAIFSFMYTARFPFAYTRKKKPHDFCTKRLKFPYSKAVMRSETSFPDSVPLRCAFCDSFFCVLFSQHITRLYIVLSSAGESAQC